MNRKKINASHFGPFKVLADKIGFDYNEYWTSQKILTAQQILRMQEVNLVADILISMVEGIKSKKQIKRYYSVYENDFPHDVDLLEVRFRRVVEVISELFPEGLSNSEFRRNHIFYTLFTAVYHCLFGLPDFKFKDVDVPRGDLSTDAGIQTARNGLDGLANYLKPSLAHLREPRHNFFKIVVAPLPTKRLENDERDFC